MAFEVGPYFYLKIAQAEHWVVYKLINELCQLPVSFFDKNCSIAEKQIFGGELDILNRSPKS